MNMKLLFVLSLSWVLVACPGGGPKKGLTCEKYEPLPPKCKDVGHPPTVNLNTISMKANPPNVCAKPGETITFTITPARPNKPEKTVSITPKEPTDTWLIGTNSPDPDEIEIPIPAWVASGEKDVGVNYDYGFAVAGGKCIDPRVNVRK